MKNFYKWLILITLLIMIFIFAFLKSPENISSMLIKVSYDLKILALIVHCIYLLFFVCGLIFKSIRNILYSLLLLILSCTAAVVSTIYLIPPNIIIFAMFFILTINAIFRNELIFDLNNISIINKIVGFLSIIFGFYYLHWVDEPLFLNALIYSPLGLVNCPTMATFCGILCFLNKPGSNYLEFFTASVTLYFGFFGIMRLGGVWVDIILVTVGMFLIVRLASKMDYNKIF